MPWRKLAQTSLANLLTDPSALGLVVWERVAAAPDVQAADQRTRTALSDQDQPDLLWLEAEVGAGAQAEAPALGPLGPRQFLLVARRGARTDVLDRWSLSRSATMPGPFAVPSQLGAQMLRRAQPLAAGMVCTLQLHHAELAQAQAPGIVGHSILMLQLIARLEAAVFGPNGWGLFNHRRALRPAIRALGKSKTRPEELLRRFTNSVWGSGPNGYDLGA